MKDIFFEKIRIPTYDHDMHDNATFDGLFIDAEIGGRALYNFVVYEGVAQKTLNGKEAHAVNLDTTYPEIYGMCRLSKTTLGVVVKAFNRYLAGVVHYEGMTRMFTVTHVL